MLFFFETAEQVSKGKTRVVAWAALVPLELLLRSASCEVECDVSPVRRDHLTKVPSVGDILQLLSQLQGHHVSRDAVASHS
jgi:hypothetical protein